MRLEKTKDFTIVRISTKQLMEYLGLAPDKHLFVSLSTDHISDDVILIASNEEQ